MSAIAQWWIEIMRTVLLICFPDSHLNNEESPFFPLPQVDILDILLPEKWGERWFTMFYHQKSSYQTLSTAVVFISTKTEPNPEIAALTRHIFRLICKWLEIQRFGVAILGRIHLILKHRFLHSRSEFSFGTVHIPVEYETTYRALHLYFYFWVAYSREFVRSNNTQQSHAPHIEASTLKE